MAETEPKTSIPATDGSTTKKESKLRYTVVPFPKIVFFYPLMFISLACGIMGLAFHSEGTVAPMENVAGTLFVIVFLINVLVIAFDFPGVKALALAFGLISLVFGVILLDQQLNVKILGPLRNVVKSVHSKLHASPVFYIVIFAILFVMIMGGILVNVLWNRWTIEPNRLTHRHSLLGDIREYPVIDLQLDKKIEDVFEYGLLLSGTLTFVPNPNTPPIRLENVPFINRAEKKILSIIRELRVTT